MVATVDVMSDATHGRGPTGTAHGVPCVRFDLDAEPAEHRFALYRSLAADVVDLTPLVDEATFRARAVQYLLDGIIVGRSPHDPVTYRRGDGHLADGTTDALCVQLFIAGSMRGVAGDHAGIDLHVGNVGVQDFAHPYAATTTHSDTLSVYVPRELVDAADTLYRHAPSIAFDRATPRGRALATAVTGLYRSARTATHDAAGELAATFVDTLNRVLQPGEWIPDDADARARLDTYICDHLDDPTLGVRVLCAVAGYSRASIYRLYQRDGGVDHYIRTLRLRRCLSQLAGTQRRRGAVVDIATRWGFRNPGHFTRLFREQFGVPPSAVLANPEPPEDPDPGAAVHRQIASIRRWQHIA